MLLLAPGWAAGQGGIPETPGVSGGAMVNMLLALLFIIALLFVGAYLLRRLGGRAFGRAGPLRVVGGLMLGPRERIALIEIGETWLVVGIVPGQIKTLHTLPKGDLPPGDAADGGFGTWLKQISERKNDGG